MNFPSLNVGHKEHNEKIERGGRVFGGLTRTFRTSCHSREISCSSNFVMIIFALTSFFVALVLLSGTIRAGRDVIPEWEGVCA